MSETIDFLESVGSRSTSLKADAYVDAVSKLDVTEAARKALLDRDPESLSRAMGARMAMQLVLVPAEDDDDGPQPDDDRDTEEVAPSAH